MKTRKRQFVVAAIIISGVVAYAFNWAASRRQSAAESEAQQALEVLDVLVTLDSNRQHVQGVALLPTAQRNDLEKSIGLLHKLPRLEVLRLAGTEVTDEQLFHIAKCRSLLMLDLNNTAVSDAGLQHLESLKKLQTLLLATTQVTAQRLDIIGQLHELKILDLSQTSLSGDLAALKSLDQLQHLLLSGVSLSDQAFVNLAQLKSLHRLTIRGSQVNEQALNNLVQSGVKVDQGDKEPAQGEEVAPMDGEEVAPRDQEQSTQNDETTIDQSSGEP